jgi:hypothetical protein
MSTGGWSIQVPPGSYAVSASGGAFTGTATSNVTVGASNREVDFRSGAAHGEVDFGGTLGPSLTIGLSQPAALAPATITFTGGSSSAGTTFEWDFGDGGTATGASPQHTFTTPGLYTVRLHGTDDTGTAGAVAVIAVEGAAGAGPGTMPVNSTSIAASSFKAKTNFATPSVSSVKFTGTIEMPAGWTPGLSDAIVDVAGVRLAFPLADADTATDASGSKFSLKYKRPKDGSPLAPGVRAKLSITLAGDLASVLADAGLRSATETRTLSGVPVRVMLGQSAWFGTLTIAEKGKAGVKATATLAP